MFGLGIPELLVIALIILLFFGAKRLPGIGTGLGKTVKEIRNIKKDLSRNKESETKKTGEDAASKKQSIEDSLVKSAQDKVANKVIDQMPSIGQAKKIKDKVDKIKKIVT